MRKYLRAGIRPCAHFCESLPLAASCRIDMHDAWASFETSAECSSSTAGKFLPGRQPLAMKYAVADTVAYGHGFARCAALMVTSSPWPRRRRAAVSARYFHDRRFDDAFLHVNIYTASETSVGRHRQRKLDDDGRHFEADALPGIIR